MVVVFGCFWLGSGVFGCGFLNGFSLVGFKSAVWFLIGGLGGGCGGRCWLWFDGLCVWLCVALLMGLCVWFCEMNRC